jgi:N-acetylglutamate synthase-like GNAT family acetyltransferase
MEDITFETAVAADLPAVRALLARCALPTDDLQEGHLAHFIVCRAGGQIVGAVGLEVIGSVGLLRSLAVAPARRGRGLAHELWRRILDRARILELARLYLLTTTAEPLFARWGFARLAREVVPDSIRATPEFAALCPSTAAVMAKDLTSAADQRAL